MPRKQLAFEVNCNVDNQSHMKYENIKDKLILANTHKSSTTMNLNETSEGSNITTASCHPSRRLTQAFPFDAAFRSKWLHTALDELEADAYMRYN